MSLEKPQEHCESNTTQSVADGIPTQSMGTSKDESQPTRLERLRSVRGIWADRDDIVEVDEMRNRSKSPVVDANKIPTHDQLFNPTLVALKILGGSGSIQEIHEKSWRLSF